VHIYNVLVMSVKLGPRFSRGKTYIINVHGDTTVKMFRRYDECAWIELIFLRTSKTFVIFWNVSVNSASLVNQLIEGRFS
jgi:hypothetical protein